MKNKTNVYTLAVCALMAAVLCILAPNSISIGPVPVSLTNLVICVMIYILNTKAALVSYTVYLLLGIAGLPVFSGYVGGIAKVAGPTGGYLVGFYLMILVGGICRERSNANVIITSIGLVIGTALVYIFGTIWFVHQMDYTYSAALSVCVYPFIPFDLIKILIGALLGKPLRSALSKAGFLTA